MKLHVWYFQQVTSLDWSVGCSFGLSLERERDRFNYYSFRTEASLESELNQLRANSREQAAAASKRQ
jgi:hypothetical protein